MFMKLKYTTRHLNFYFLKIHILRLLFCVYIVGMAGFILASRRNDGQKTKDGSGDFTGKEKKIPFSIFLGQSDNFFLDLSQEEDPSQNLLKASESKSNNKVEEAILDLQETLLEASKLNNRASKSKSNSNVTRAVRDLHRVNANASVDPQDTDKWTPLMFSAERGSELDIDCLVNAGANVNAINNKKQSSITIAVINNKGNAVEALLRHNANIILPDCNGDTALTHNQNWTQKGKHSQKVKKGKHSQKGKQRIEDLLYTRLAHDKVKDTGSLNDHIREDHYGNGQQVISVDRMENKQTNSGVSKTAFPSEWSDEKSFTAVTSILYSPEKLEQNFEYDNVRLIATGKFEGLPIKVVMEIQDSKINVITAFPIRNK